MLPGLYTLMSWSRVNLLSCPILTVQRVRLSTAKGDKSFELRRRNETTFQPPNFAYDLYFQGQRVAPLAEEGFVGDIHLPNVLGKVNTNKKRTVVKVMDFGVATGNGIGFPTLNMLSHIAAFQNHTLRIGETANMGVLRLLERVSDFRLADQMKSMLEQEHVNDKKGGWGSWAHAGFLYSPRRRRGVKFSFCQESHAYSLPVDVFCKMPSINFWEGPSVRGGPLQTTPVSTVEEGILLDRFEFKSDGSFSIDDKRIGFIVSLTWDAIIDTQPRPIDQEIEILG